MKILITGAAGFIGGHLIDHLASSHEVHAVARQPLPTSEVHWIRHDLTQPLEQANLPKTIDAVIHLAQSRYYREFPDHANDIYAVNVHSTFMLLEYARKSGAKHFVIASSGSVYGYRDDPFKETDSAAPSNFYATSKYMGEMLVSNYKRFFHTVTCRLFFVYGVRQNPNMLIPRLIHSVNHSNPITLQGQDGMRINPIHISDAIEALTQTLTLEGDHVINVGGAQVLTLREISNIIAECEGREPVFTIQNDVKPNHLIGNTAKMHALLHVPRMSFSEGVIPLCLEALQAEGGST